MFARIFFCRVASDGIMNMYSVRDSVMIDSYFCKNSFFVKKTRDEFFFREALKIWDPFARIIKSLLVSRRSDGADGTSATRRDKN